MNDTILVVDKQQFKNVESGIVNAFWRLGPVHNHVGLVMRERSCRYMTVDVTNIMTSKLRYLPDDWAALVGYFDAEEFVDVLTANYPGVDMDTTVSILALKR